MQSWAGALACLTGGCATAAWFVLDYRDRGYIPVALGTYEILAKTMAVSLISTMVEALPIAEYDNLTVSATAAIASWSLFGL